jgi:hypothetical protein
METWLTIFGIELGIYGAGFLVVVVLGLLFALVYRGVIAWQWRQDGPRHQEWKNAWAQAIYEDRQKYKARGWEQFVYEDRKKRQARGEHEDDTDWVHMAPPPIVWCRDCRHQVEPDPIAMAARAGAELSVPDWRQLLVCSACGGRRIDFVHLDATTGKRSA